MNTPPSSQLQLDEALILHIRTLLGRRYGAVRFERRLEKAFLAQRTTDFSRMVAEGGPAVIILYLMIAAGGYIMFHPQGTDLEIWLSTIGAAAIGIIIGMSSGYVPSMLKRFQWYVSAGGGVALFALTLASLLYRNHDLAQHTTYVVMLIITIITLAIRLLLPAAIATCIVGGGMAALTGLLFGTHINWLLVSHYLIGSSVSSLFIAYMLERQERRGFLQSLLLEWESKQLDVLNRRLDDLARKDQLSGLANRRHLDEILAEEWERARREQTSLALLFVDVDHFKLYNDTYGHPAGDACLAQIGKVLGNTLKRPADLAARYGGEEFVLLLPNTDTAGARKVAERIIRQVDELSIPHSASSCAPHVTVSIGIATMIPDSARPLEELLDLADSALYISKSEGRHRLTIARDPRQESAA